MPSQAPIIVVSGLPRSGTSLAMQMIHAGGVSAVTDGQRVNDDDNPRGYFEFERVKQLKTDKGWIAEAGGKVVKVIHMLLAELPDDRPYRVIFMERDVREVVKSQSTMLARSGRTGAQLPPERLMAIYEQQLKLWSSGLLRARTFKYCAFPTPRWLPIPKRLCRRSMRSLGARSTSS